MPLVFQAFDWEHGVYLGSTHGFGNQRRQAYPVRSARFPGRRTMAMLPFLRLQN